MTTKTIVKSKKAASKRTSRKANKQSKQTKNKYPKERKKGSNEWLLFLCGKTPEGAKHRNKFVADHVRMCKQTSQEFNRFEFNQKMATMNQNFNKIANCQFNLQIMLIQIFLR